MSIDFYTESPPRISFSSDLLPNNNQTQITNQTDLTDFTFHSQPTNDFHFSFSSSSTSINEPSPADELFSGGLIKPLNSKTHSKKSIETENPETDQPIKPTTTNKSIWGIKRSSSLHCEESIHKKNSSSFWSLPLLARSNSTGSVSVSVQKNGSKENQNHSQKQQKQIRNSSSSSSSSTNSSFSMYNFSQKPPLKKNYGNGIRIVNVPSSFGFSSLFRTSSNNGKERKNKK